MAKRGILARMQAMRIAAINKAHREARTARGGNMLLLLTEMKNPDAYALRIMESLALEERAIQRQIAERDHPANLPAAGPEVDAALEAVLKAIAEERAACAQRLANRKAEIAAGETQRRASALEESDPAIRIMANRRRQQLEDAEAYREMQKKILEHQKRIMEIRLRNSPWNKK
ncbi:MAG: hypothetical protein IT557_10535 [Alphaproteobacteria bacterium]|nr:hypothetical protein [Alphaproteobacteria bacterium]